MKKFSTLFFSFIIIYLISQPVNSKSKGIKNIQVSTSASRLEVIQSNLPRIRFSCYSATPEPTATATVSPEEEVITSNEVN